MIARLEFMHSWNKNGVPNSFTMPYIYFTVGFLTGAMQAHARKHVIPIDSLNFSMVMTKYWTPEEIKPGFDSQGVEFPEGNSGITEDGSPEDGVYVDGLFIEAARWDMETMTLEESLLGQPRVRL